ncbi:MAG: hypothetical protein COS96_02590 [Candidatus Nealsonbacteria bacterium CG07_land_8_20_14_0_80_39_13]|nr:MAG: hypothetical protein COS96_02590 [Candidatus Nealsonbacteria bacterium CG07_land_8_20_14_0_80_39_13]
MDLCHELKGLIAAELGMPISEVTDELSAGSVDAWDSLGHLKLILRIEENFKVKFKTEQIVEATTVRKIYEQLKEFGVSDGEK